MHHNYVTVFADCRCTVGEGIIWSKTEQALYWVDLFNGHIFRGIDTGEYEQYKLNIGKIGGIVLMHNNFLMLFAARGRVWRWCAGELPLMITELEAASETRFNDVIAGPSGEVFCGVSPNPDTGQPGSLWVMRSNKQFSCLEPGIGNPNGMGFSPDLQYFYFTSTRERIIYRYNYDRNTQTISGKTVFIIIPSDEGKPDGMTVDSKGCVWSAQWDGSRVVRYSSKGKKIMEYFLPTSRITSIAFGGAKLSRIFISTANYKRVRDKNAGMIFELKSTICGLPEFCCGGP